MSYFKIIKLDATPSTNNYLKNKYKSRDVKDGDLVWTKNQTSGRGQRENNWFSKPVESLTFSIFKQYKDENISNPFIISILVSLGIHEALSTINLPNLKIKWPNDILSCNKKIGGILIENTFKNNKLTNSILGFGLNVNQSDFSKFPHAASLFSLTKKKWNIEKVFEALIYALEQDEFTNLVKHRDANLETFNSYLWRKGKPSKFQGVQSVFEAIPLEVTKQGGLVITSLENEQKKELALANARILYTQN